MTNPRVLLCAAAGFIAGLATSAAHASQAATWVFTGGMLVGLVIADATRKGGDRS